MINWELPHEQTACPHCGSTDTQVTLELLGLIRYSCRACRKTFATHGENGPTDAESKPIVPDVTPRRV